MTPRDPNDPNARALAIADGVLEAGGWGLRARGCALAAEGEGVGGGRGCRARRPPVTFTVGAARNF
jgi:hypothetical protein